LKTKNKSFSGITLNHNMTTQVSWVRIISECYFQEW